MNNRRNTVIELNGSRFELVDFLKGFSIFTIVVMHLIQGYIGQIPQKLDLAASLGGTGVHVFFLCSGFGLFLSYSKKEVSFADFIKRRVSKIYIPYIIIVVISALLPYMYSGERLYALCSHIFLYKMFIPEYIGSFGNHFWFISTILQLYAVFIPLYNLRKKLKNDKLFFVSSLCVSIAWWCLVSIAGLHEERVFNSFFLQYLWEFVLGMVIANRLLNSRRIDIKTPIIIMTAFFGTALMCIMAMSSGWLKIFNDIPALIGYLSIALLVYIFSSKSVKNLFMSISKISFEWYLIHILVFKTCSQIKVIGFPLLIVRGFIMFALSIIVAAMYSRLFKLKKAN